MLICCLQCVCWTDFIYKSWNVLPFYAEDSVEIRTQKCIPYPERLGLKRPCISGHSCMQDDIHLPQHNRGVEGYKGKCMKRTHWLRVTQNTCSKTSYWINYQSFEVAIWRYKYHFVWRRHEHIQDFYYNRSQMFCSITIDRSSRMIKVHDRIRDPRSRYPRWSTVAWNLNW